MTKHLILILLFSVTTLFSCARMEVSSVGLVNQVQLNPSTEPIKKHFEESKWNHYFLFQLVPTSEVKIADVLASHATAEEKIVGLQVKKQQSFINGLICTVCFGIYCPETTTISGDVVATPAKP